MVGWFDIIFRNVDDEDQLLTNDGHGNHLDAKLLNGYHDGATTSFASTRTRMIVAADVDNFVGNYEGGHNLFLRNQGNRTHSI